ncbi:MAG: glycosyltransferase [Rhizobiales bacterium]|nr:glycosyltransferase [Hyphomicrobiales bacterium]
MVLADLGFDSASGMAGYAPGTIADTPRHVLPQLSLHDTMVCLKRLAPDELDLALRRKVFPLVWSPEPELFVCSGESAFAFAVKQGLRCIAQVERETFHEAVRRTHAEELLAEATDGLRLARPEFSAYRRFTGPQAAVGVLLTVMLAAGLLLSPSLVITVCGWVLGLFFLSLIGFRALALFSNVSPEYSGERPIPDAQSLPVYTVLVPLFRETAVLEKLISALACLRYPNEKLDIKLILEEDDWHMRRAVASFDLPGHFDVIVVPCGHPQTKPRALNFALHFAKGELLTIYDAEDVPDPDQLLVAENAFAKAGPALACVQASLTFHNPNENWLTRQFAIEYGVLFDLLLPELANEGLPLPLGGTSNHFRVAALRDAGGWDAWNVTEDADLGLRFSRMGYETGTIDSRTYEEANCRLRNWIKQRARWLKGFLHTWLVHMRDLPRLRAELGLSGMWALQAYTAGVFVSALLYPPLTLAAIWQVFVNGSSLPGLGIERQLAASLCLAVFLTGYGLAIAAGRRALRRQGIEGWWLTLLTMPAYWMLMFVAAWLALWQFVTQPHHWNKTEHGISSMTRRTTLHN